MNEIKQQQAGQHFNPRVAVLLAIVSDHGFLTFR
jgi:hypothetical protein